MQSILTKEIQVQSMIQWEQSRSLKAVLSQLSWTEIGAGWGVHKVTEVPEIETRRSHEIIVSIIDCS